MFSFVAVGAVALAAGFAAHELWSHDGVSPSTAPVFPSHAAEPEARPPQPPLAPTSSAKHRADAGSIFRNRLATAGSPVDGTEFVLATPLATECVDHCPLSLRVLNGPSGSILRDQVVVSIGVNLDLLCESPQMPPELGDRLRHALGAIRQRLSDERSGSGGSCPPVRAFFVSTPNPEFGPRTWSTGLAIYDHEDGGFDKPRENAPPCDGRRILIARVEREVGEGPRTELVCGAVEVGEGRGRLTRSGPSSEGAALHMTFGTLRGHFGGAPEGAAGLYLAQDGAVYAYGDDLELKLLKDSGDLGQLLAATLRRP